MLYRTLKPLQRGRRVIEAGRVTRLDWVRVEDRELLIERRAIKRLSTPPLDQFPGWTRRAERLAEIGVYTAAQFIEVDGAMLAGHLGFKPSTIERWKRELLDTFTEQRPKRG